jgi:hypothetical protein
LVAVTVRVAELPEVIDVGDAESLTVAADEDWTVRLMGVVATQPQLSHAWTTVFLGPELRASEVLSEDPLTTYASVLPT